MNCNKILFALILKGSSLSHSFENFSFLHKKYSARKAGFEKTVVGFALVAAARAQNNSTPLNIAQNVATVGGGACVVAGLYQILVDVMAAPEAKNDLYPDTSRLDAAVNKLITNKVFLSGAALGVVGFLLQNGDAHISDTSFACHVAALTLMGLTIGAQLNKDYMPEITNFFNK